ncbi:MAG: hypothetical protein KBB88_00905 [Candidatus Pacebacteria bacterium]|nr:hypothetical protein [Candidatus Paceibacterota bacterium]
MELFFKKPKTISEKPEYIEKTTEAHIGGDLERMERELTMNNAMEVLAGKNTHPLAHRIPEKLKEEYIERTGKPFNSQIDSKPEALQYLITEFPDSGIEQELTALRQKTLHVLATYEAALLGGYDGDTVLLQDMYEKRRVTFEKEFATSYVPQITTREQAILFAKTESEPMQKESTPEEVITEIENTQPHKVKISPEKLFQEAA